MNHNHQRPALSLLPRRHHDAAVLTVDSALKLLAADLALQRTDSRLLVQLDRDGVFVVTEKAGKRRRKSFVLLVAGVSTVKRILLPEPRATGSRRRTDLSLRGRLLGALALAHDCCRSKFCDVAMEEADGPVPDGFQRLMIFAMFRWGPKIGWGSRWQDGALTVVLKDIAVSGD